MFKLLTEPEAKKVAREYARRRGVVILAGLILVLVIGIAGLLPSFVLLNVRENEVLERVRITDTLEPKAGGPDVEVWLSLTNRRLALLSPELDTDRPSVSIGQILEQKVPGIRLTGISWIKADDKVAISVAGISRDRQTLVTFENRISTSGYFSDVTLPISDFAKDRDISFQIKFSPL